MNAPLIEEFENESEGGWPPAQPQGLAPPIGSRCEEDIEMDAVKGILYLSKCFSHFVFALCYCFLLVLKFSLLLFLQVT